MKPFLTPGGWQLVREICVLKCFSSFEMRFYVQYSLVCESFAFVNACVEERSLCVRYFSRKLDSGMGWWLFACSMDCVTSSLFIFHGARARRYHQYTFSRRVVLERYGVEFKILKSP